MNEWIEHTDALRPVDPRMTVEVELTNGTKQIGKADTFDWGDGSVKAFRMIGYES